MSIDRNIQMTQFNGTDYDNLYPVTLATNVKNLGSYVVCTISPALAGVTVTLTCGLESFSAVSNNSGIATIIVVGFGRYTISFSRTDVTTDKTYLDIYFMGQYNFTAYYEALVTYTVRIDESNSNSLSSVVYQDDAVGMTKGSSAWNTKSIFMSIKPCVFNNGSVYYYLNPDDFSQQADGTPSNLVGGDGDIMIEFKKFAYRIYRSGSYLYVSITNNPSVVASDSRFKYYAFSRNSEGDRDKMYIGAYKGYTSSSKLHSWSGYNPTVNQTIGTFRTQAQANGTGYQQFTFYQLTALQCLFLIKYGNLDSQTALGMGYVSASAASATGSTNANGMYYGSTSGTTHVKFAGIEDFWGNVYDWIDGLFSNSSRYILTAYNNFNDSGSGYTSQGQGATSDVGGYISQTQGINTATGFIVKTASGSTTTFFADNGYLSASRLPYFGGNWSVGSDAGAFLLYVSASASNTFTSIGARLSYC